ncbi:deoxyribodipyrimidine photo-lyase (single-stranded DNA-specific) [Modicisalibacter ilicicola DSM 19980]|uniref:Cryptochrome DASH n=1 Tax=Modicisalibacter ilicicola DSM 19980 TaxID=1121942 RepID=A0A1M5EM69_9GAMM|nr:DASH family cryptochrome [Halomonas ilicicola]SHF80297.1 deoxyribodipyrimidine photo-lyase (single-stranded DNA-specific) [Halomonas ilicicola DSM 19980]
MSITGLYWFTQDLRLHDNATLLDATRRCDRLLCVYCIDPAWFETGEFGSARLGRHRWRFLNETLDDLEQRLAARGQHLIRCFRSPGPALDALIEQHRVDVVVRSQSADWYLEKAWESLQRRWPDVEFAERVTHTLFDRDALPFTLDELPGSFTQFRKRVEPLGIAAPVAAPEALPPPVDNASLSSPPSPPPMPETTDDPDSAFRGGEREGLAHLDAYFGGSLPLHYKQTRNALEGWQNSSKFSAWLANGALSGRLVIERLRDFEQRVGANESTYWLYFELLWREFYQWYAHAHGARLFRLSGLKGESPRPDRDRARFAAWGRGETGLPIVDACMRELNATGYMSNRGRQLVASALINELNQDWRWGAAYFEQQLVDYDVASNWGNWQYLGGVGADPRGLRRFDLAKQTAQYDPQGTFIARWLNG